MNQEAEYFYKQGIQAVITNHYDAAEFFLLKSAEIEPSAANYSCLGWFYGSILRREKKALSFFRKAILHNPKNGNLYNDYGALLLRLGRYQDSIKWFSKAVRLVHFKKKHFSLYNLALVYYSWRRPERSLRYLRLALKYQPDFEKAIELYQSILEEAPKSVF